MGNLITSNCVDNSEYVKMSNNLTNVVISLLALSGSALAVTDHEKELAIWFANRDQDTYGRGVVGFDLNEIPWTVAQFETEKRFLLNMIRRAQSKQDWSRHSYEPREDWAIDHLEMLYQMISRFPATCIDPQAAVNWQSCKPTEFILCPKHNVLHHLYGCVVCNDGDPI